MARRVFELSGRNPDDVTAGVHRGVLAGQDLAPRPRNSTMSLAKLEATGYETGDAWDALTAYLAR